MDERLLVVDIGNTNIKWVLFQDERIVHHWSMSTVGNRTQAELRDELERFFCERDCVREEVVGVAISSVVPVRTPEVVEICREMFEVEPLVAAPGLAGWLPSLYDNPHEVGTDRIVNALAATHMYGAPVIVVGLGTATIFDVVDEDERYLGGLILPGMKIAAEALTEQVALLSPVDLAKPEKVVGQTAQSCLQSGAFYSGVAQLDGVVERIRREHGAHYKVIATGGLAELVSAESTTIQTANRWLLTEGLRILWQLNRPSIR